MQVEILDEHGMPLPSTVSNGRRYVLGEHGRRYTIRITNPSSRRVEVVVSVDGLDVIDGKPASLSKRGYVVNPYGELRIDGWRTSLHSVAAFRFGRVADSYAARTGSPRNVGVIGVAVFAEAQPRVQRPIIPRPEYWDGASGKAGGKAEESAASAPRASQEAGAGGGGTASATPSVRSKGQAAGDASSVGRAETKAARAKQSAPPVAGAAPKGSADTSLAEAERWRRTPLPEERPGLGTEFGERRHSSVQYTTFVRQSSRPVGMTEIRYNDAPGLARLGIVFPPRTDVDDDLWQRETANPFPAGNRFASPPPPRY